MMDEKLLIAIINAGVGAMIAGTIIYLTYRLVLKLALGMGTDVVKSFAAQAEALSRQAVSMESMTKSLQEYVLRDNTEHREMLVLLKYVAQSQETVRNVCEQHVTHRKDSCPYKEAILKEAG